MNRSRIHNPNWLPDSLRTQDLSDIRTAVIAAIANPRIATFDLDAIIDANVADPRTVTAGERDWILDTLADILT